MNDKTRKKVIKFVEEYKQIVAEVYGQENRDNALAEDINTFYTLDIAVLKYHIRFTTTYTGICGGSFTDSEKDDDEITEWLRKWRADMSRARRYWAMSSDQLDKIADGEAEDINEED